MIVRSQLSRHTRPQSELYGYGLFLASRVLMYGTVAVFCVLRTQGSL